MLPGCDLGHAGWPMESSSEEQFLVTSLACHYVKLKVELHALDR